MKPDVLSKDLGFALFVIPAEAGIQWCPDVLDSGFRRSDELLNNL
jgi:hypothetical protein